MDEKIKTWTLRFPAKENPNMEKALFDWPIVLQYDVKAKDPLISRKFSGMKFFYAGVLLTNQKPHTFVCPFDKLIKSLYFRSFVVSVLFARFHFKVIRKSLFSSLESVPFCQLPKHLAQIMGLYLRAFHVDFYCKEIC